MKNIFVSAIIAAAGNSTRMGKDKIFIPLCNIPAIAHTLIAFENSDTINELVISCKAEQETKLKSIIKEYSISKFKAFSLGGISRQDTVFSGVQACSRNATHFAIHDAARCLITNEEINRVVFDAVKHRASSLGVPCKDTLKVLGTDNFVVSTPNRDTLWHIQTPQVFEKNLYLAAMAVAKKSNRNYTDDCQLVENLGNSAHIVRGNYSNLKLTTPDDVAVFENILNLRGKTL